MGAPDLQVLAYGRHQVGETVLNLRPVRARPPPFRQGINVTVAVKREPRCMTHEILEGLVAGHEIGFA